MSDLNNLLVQALGYTTNTSSLINTSALAKTYSTTANNTNFAALLSQLERNLTTSQIETSNTSTTGSGYVSISSQKTSTMPSITAIVQKIKESDSGYLSIDDQVSRYLIDNYGGSKSAVILALTGAQSLPTQMRPLENHIFQTIVSKISNQVRVSMYTGQDSDSASDNIDVDNVDFTSSPSVSSEENIDI